VGRLDHGVGVVEFGAWFPKPEPQLPEEALALTYPEIDLELLLEEGGEGLPVPEGSREADLVGSAAQGHLHRLHLGLGETAGTTGTVALGEAGKALLVEAVDPVLHHSRGVAEQPAHFRGGQSLSHEEKSVEAMVVARLIGAADRKDSARWPG